MAITVAQFRSHLDAARSAIGSGDYASAQIYARQASVCLAGLPDGEHATEKVAWRQDLKWVLDQIKDGLDAAGAASTFIQQTKVTYT